MNKKIIYDSILVILVIGILICAGSLFLELRFHSEYQTRDDTFLWFDVENGKYADLYINVKNNQLVGVKETKLFKECEIIADYFMAANHYKINLELGRENEAKQYKKEMEVLVPKLKDNENVIEDIHQSLKIPY